ncbi:hypothetical protein [Treponema sp. OMZ 799]|uniref:hypothetical protein n=1 Tax=Treponema sp. OMZ 799 TaxID=2563668 RepID=UPI0020A41F43|nr:hypothetical protein [Treponema sp. OMZ 799]
MKTKNIFIKSFEICTMMMLCSILLHAEIPVEKVAFSLTQSIDLNLDYSLTAEAKNPFFEVYTSAKIRDHRPKFALIPQGFSLKFSPLLYREKKKLYPALSFFYGGITKSSFLNRMLFKDSFEKKPFYEGIGLPPKYLIGISKSKFDASLGTEFAIKNFNLVFFSEQKQKELWPNLSFCAAYKNDNEDYLVNFSILSSLTNSAYSQFNIIKPNYDQFYSLECILGEKRSFTASIFSAAGGIKLPYRALHGNNKNLLNSNLNFWGRAEYNFQSEYFMLNTGTLFERDGSLKAFVQPKIETGVLDIGLSYNFLRKYFKKKKLYENSHAGGMGVDIILTNFKFKGEVYYEDAEWDLKGQIKIPIKLFVNTAFSIKGNTKLEDKSKNPFIVKNYSFSSDIKIKFNKAFNISLSSSFMQKNRIIKINKTPYIAWEEGVFKFSTQAEFIKKTKLTLNSFKGEIILESAKPFIKGSLSYKINF